MRHEAGRVIRRALAFLLAAITDPVTKGMSSARLAGLSCVVIAGIVGLRSPKDGAATVAAFISGGAVAFLTRTKADAP